LGLSGQIQAEEPPKLKKIEGKGVVITPTHEVFRTVTQPLTECTQWYHINNLKKANEQLKTRKDITVVIVDSLFLNQITMELFDSLFDKTLRKRCKFILLKDGRIASKDVPDQFHGILSKPIRPSLITGAWNELMSPKPPRFQENLRKEFHYEELALNVLLVEDNLVNQKVASLQLKKMKCSVTIASNGLEALQQVQLNLRPEGISAFDIILMDVMMPVMDGIVATAEIRKWEGEQHLKYRIPIIALTAHAMIDDKDKCLSAGMDGYLSKPLDKERLAFELQECKKRKPQI